MKTPTHKLCGENAAAPPAPLSGALLSFFFAVIIAFGGAAVGGLMLGMSAGMKITAPSCAGRKTRRTAPANNPTRQDPPENAKAVHSVDGAFPVRVHSAEWRDLFRALRLLQSDREAIQYEEWAETHREFCDRLNAIERRINTVGGALVGDDPGSPEWAGALTIAAERLDGEGPTPRIAFPYFAIPPGSRGWTEEGDKCPHRRVAEAEYFLLSPEERRHAIFFGEDPGAYPRRRAKMRESFDAGFWVMTASREDVYDCWPLMNRPDRRAVHSPLAGRFAFADDAPAAVHSPDDNSPYAKNGRVLVAHMGAIKLIRGWEPVGSMTPLANRITQAKWFDRPTANLIKRCLKHAGEEVQFFRSVAEWKTARDAARRAARGRFAFPDDGDDKPSVEESGRVRYTRTWGKAARLTIEIESPELGAVGGIRKAAWKVLDEAVHEFEDYAAAAGFELPASDDDQGE